MLVKRLVGKTAIVTGGATGIGRAIVERLASEGASVAILDIDDDSAKQVARELRDEADVLSVHCDVTDEDSVRRAIDAVNSELGTVDVLINNAGDLYPGRITELPIELWERGLRINLTAPFLVAKHVLPVMLSKDEGVIVNVGSQGGLVGVPERTSYISAKAGMLGLTRSITADFAPRIRCNALCPGSTLTPLLEHSAAESGDADSYLAYAARRQFVGRLATTQEIAAAAAFLASPDSSYLHGAVVVADGGLTAAAPRTTREMSGVDVGGPDRLGDAQSPPGH